MSWYRQQLEDWLKTLEIIGNTVYDIGGAQGDVRPRLKSCLIADYQVLDLPDYDLQESGWYNYDPNEKNRGLRKADVIFCLEVFDYITRPDIAFVNINDLLKDGGKAYVTFPFIYPHHNELENEGLRYTEHSIRKLAEYEHNAGYKLKVSNIWYRTDKSGLLKAFYQADGMHPAKEYDHHDVTGFIVELTK